MMTTTATMRTRAQVISVNYGYKRAKSHNFAVKPGEIAVRCDATRRALDYDSDVVERGARSQNSTSLIAAVIRLSWRNINDERRERWAEDGRCEMANGESTA